MDLATLLDAAYAVDRDTGAGSGTYDSDQTLISTPLHAGQSLVGAWPYGSPEQAVIPAQALAKARIQIFSRLAPPGACSSGQLRCSRALWRAQSPGRRAREWRAMVYPEIKTACRRLHQP